jgi:diguanylate cyclase (GGDEF)-like protein/PAS domain S-box-containing protein
MRSSLWSLLHGWLIGSARAKRLHRLLADNSSDAIVCGALDGKASYVSPALAAMAARREDELVGHGWIDAAEPRERPAIHAAFARLDAGAPVASARFRYPRAGAAAIWLEMRVRRAAESPEFVASIRDISEQKRAEEQLADANAELSALSITDPLTGIANRRHFDQMLCREWKRAMRNASPMALLMIDVDLFKSYNDTYGHPAGDRCLRMVAQAIAGAVLRAGDLACRYGGDEFAVILPETVAEPAMRVADRIIEAIAARGIAHASSPHRRVTVSIGIASTVPTIAASPAALLEAADAALYDAKRHERNRAAIAPPICAAASDIGQPAS